MNKPYLVVDGKKHAIVSVQVEDAVTKTEQYYYDTSKDYMDNIVDFSKHIINPAKQNELIETIEKRIESLGEINISLAEDFMEGAIKSDLPFADAENLKAEYESNVHQINALYEALKLIRECHPHD